MDAVHITSVVCPFLSIKKRLVIEFSSRLSRIEKRKHSTFFNDIGDIKDTLHKNDHHVQIAVDGIPSNLNTN